MGEHIKESGDTKTKSKNTWQSLTLIDAYSYTWFNKVGFKSFPSFIFLYN